MLHAQNKSQGYIYNIASGASWANDVFAKYEKAEAAKRAKQAPIKGAPNFEKTFTTIYNNFVDHQTYNDSIFFELSHDEWIAMFLRRAKRYSEIYAQNNALLHDVQVYFKKPNIPEAAYDSLFFWTRHFYHENMSDIFLMEDLVGDFLIPHYQNQDNYERLEFCYNCAGMYLFQSARIGNTADAHKSAFYFMKAYGMRNMFANFTDPLSRYYYISAFVNLCILHAQEMNVTFDESHSFIAETERLFAKPEVQKIFAQDKQLAEYAQWSLLVSKFRNIMIYINQGMKDPKLFNELYKEYCEARNEINGDFVHLNHRYYAFIGYDDYLVEAYKKNITWDQAYDKFVYDLRNDKNIVSAASKSAYRLYYYYNLLTSYVYLLNKSSKTDEQKAVAVEEIMYNIMNVIQHVEHMSQPFEKGQIMTNIATNKDLYKYLNLEQKKDFIFKILMLEQPTMYVHSTMVADLSRVLSESLIDKKPEYFVGVFGYKDAEDVQNHKEELLDYIYTAAGYHDLGKIAMPMVIGNNFRALTDHESEIVHQHPDRAMQFFDIDPWFDQFRDVSLGHHKWYNGGGYPETFDNQKSPVYPIINIVMFCDCMDAATENIGRNYHTPKPFEKVMDEFVEGSGTNYDPTLVDFVMNDVDVYKKLKQKVSDGRMQHYYKMYMKYLNNGDNEGQNSDTGSDNAAHN